MTSVGLRGDWVENLRAFKGNWKLAPWAREYVIDRIRESLDRDIDEAELSGHSTKRITDMAWEYFYLNTVRGLGDLKEAAEFELSKLNQRIDVFAKALEAESNAPHPVTQIIQREVVKIPCRFCGSLNEVTNMKCLSCGAPIR